MSSDVEPAPPSAVRGTTILLCGLPASGETTLARALEPGCPALRLSEDEWVARMFPPGAAHDNGARDRIKAVQWDIAVRAARLGLDAVLDRGLSVRGERDHYRALTASAGLPVEPRHLAADRDELLRRIAARNATLPPETFRIEADRLDAGWALLEPPAERELLGWSNPPPVSS